MNSETKTSRRDFIKTGGKATLAATLTASALSSFARGSQALENSYARFIWNGYQNLASFVTVPGGTGSGYMSTIEKGAALSADGAPANP